MTFITSNMHMAWINQSIFNYAANYVAFSGYSITNWYGSYDIYKTNIFLHLGSAGQTRKGTGTWSHENGGHTYFGSI
jgi:hypothetical protein